MIPSRFTFLGLFHEHQCARDLMHAYAWGVTSGTDSIHYTLHSGASAVHTGTMQAVLLWLRTSCLGYRLVGADLWACQNTVWEGARAAQRCGCGAGMAWATLMG